MNGSPKQETLELEVADFGPIVEAKVDLRPLTVFIGPSNTGKSYLTILIYALHRFFSGAAGSGHRSFHRGYRILQVLEMMELPRATIDALGETVRMFLDSGEPPDQWGVLPTALIADLIRSNLVKDRGALRREICRCFGIDDAGPLTRKGRNKGARIELRRPMSNGSTRFEHQFTLAGQATEVKTDDPRGNPGTGRHRGCR